MPLDLDEGITRSQQRRILYQEERGRLNRVNQNRQQQQQREHHEQEEEEEQQRAGGFLENRAQERNARIDSNRLASLLNVSSAVVNPCTSNNFTNHQQSRQVVTNRANGRERGVSPSSNHSSANFSPSISKRKRPLDEMYANENPSAYKIPRQTIKESDNLHDVFFNRTLTPRRKLEKMLQMMQLDFDNTRKQIDIDLLHNRDFCRQLNNEWAEDLSYRLQNVQEGNYCTILNRTLFIVYEFEEDTESDIDIIQYGVVDGNIRLAAARHLNENVHDASSAIDTITVDYILKVKPTAAQAIIIATLASNEAEKDRLEYDEKEILKNARLILKHQRNILNIPPISTSFDTAQEWQRDYEKIVRDELAKVLKVDVQRVVSSVWRTVFIPDDDFNDMLPVLATRGTSIKKLEKLCNAYKRRPTQTLQLCMDVDMLDADQEEFFEALDNITGMDWQLALKEKKAYDFELTDNQHLQQIMGETYDELSTQERKTTMEKFLKWTGINHVSRNSRYPDTPSKIAYLTAKFPIWETSLHEPAKRLTEKRNKNDVSDSEEEQIVPKKTAKKPIKIFLKNVPIETVRLDYMNHLKQHPHIAGLLAHFIKHNSSNLDKFPENNIVCRKAAQFETQDGNFDWDAFDEAIDAQNADNNNT